MSRILTSAAGYVSWTARLVSSSPAWMFEAGEHPVPGQEEIDSQRRGKKRWMQRLVCTMAMAMNP